MIDASKAGAGGNMISTAEDLGNWDKALYRNTPFTQETKDKMFSCPTPLTEYDPKKPQKYFTDGAGRHHPLSEGEYQKVRYGFGIHMAYLPNEQPQGYLWHMGRIRGFTSYISRIIPHELCILNLQNNDELPDEVQFHLQQIFFGE